MERGGLHQVAWIEKVKNGKRTSSFMEIPASKVQYLTIVEFSPFSSIKCSNTSSFVLWIDFLKI